jgi:voltage-gated potassium channel Kch
MELARRRLQLWANTFWRYVILEPDRLVLPVRNVIAAHPLRRAMQAALLAIFVGGGIFSLVEHKASYPDGIWWAIVTMTTVGYGDIAPKTPEIRLMAGFVILSGIIFVAAFTASVTSHAVKKLGDAAKTDELNDDFEAVIQSIRDHHLGIEDGLAQIETLNQELRERETGKKSSARKVV